MEWKKRKEQLSSLQEIIEYHTKMPIIEFLNPKKNPFLSGLKESVALVKECIQKQMPIHVVGDYDADGVMSSSILYLALKEAAGYEPSIRLPRRFSEGYGLSMKIIDEIHDGLIITVDNGIAAAKQIQAAKEKGLKVIVIDHHLAPADGVLPEADVLIDPQAVPGSEFDQYCGAGLAYRFACELVPDSKLLTPMLALASIGTVADVVPLVGDNRNLVIDGLEAVRHRQVTLGLSVLLDAMKLEYVTEEDYGFGIGPVINASGRLLDDGPMDVLRFMCTHRTVQDADYQVCCEELQETAEEALKRNEKRKQMVSEYMDISYQMIQDYHLEESYPIILYDARFSEGIIGIIAGRIAEEYRKPCLVFTDAKTPGEYKGSGRTSGNIHLKEMLDQAADCFVKYGGHAGAAGMTIRSENMAELYQKTHAYLKNYDFSKDQDVRYYDLEIEADAVAQTIRELEMYAPYGQNNPKPVFKVDHFECTPVDGKFAKELGKTGKHLRFFGRNFNVIGFNIKEAYEEAGSPKVMDILGNLSQNYFNGKFSNQLEICEFKGTETTNKTDTFRSLQDLMTFI